jgi:heme A synthase
MTMGNIVSATGSGLGCPDWPLCHGRLLPPAQTEVLIEFSHRLKAIPFTILLLITVALTWRRTTARAPRRLTLVLAALVIAQIGLGAVTVLLKLPHLVSTAHLVNALVILAGLIVLAEGSRPPVLVPARVGRLAVAGLAALLLQLALGGYVRHAGAGLACPAVSCPTTGRAPCTGFTGGSASCSSASSCTWPWPRGERRSGAPRLPRPPSPSCRSGSASPPC